MSHNLVQDFRPINSLWDIVSLSFGFVGNEFNRAALLCYIIIASYLSLGVFIFSAEVKTQHGIFQSFLAKLTNFSISYSIGITGFLIAGLSILISVGHQGLFLSLAKKLSKKKHKTRSINEFQYLIYNVITPLVWHFILILLSLCLSLIFSFDSDKEYAVASAINISVETKLFFSSSLFLIFSSYLVFCFLELKSLIWNLYSVIVLDILVQDHLSKQTTGAKK